MDALHRFAAILVADLRERSRSLRFWLMVLVVAAATFWMLPPADAGYSTLSLPGDARGAYSSAWVGMTVAMIYSGLMSLVGFYVIRGTLVRDIDSRVWQLLVATPMTRATFLLAKWASHMLVFCMVGGIGLALALVLQWVRAEDRSIDVIELVKPFVLLNLPGLALTAAIAVWYDLLPFTRRTLGNVLFFFTWVFITSMSMVPLEGNDDRARHGWMSDPSGMVVAARAIQAHREAQTGETFALGLNVGIQVRDQGVDRFEWREWNVDARQLPGRALWLALSMALVVAAAPLLDWAASRGLRVTAERDNGGRALRWLDRVLTPFARGPVGILATAELSLALRQRRVWWWLAALGALVAQAVAPDKGLHAALLLAWLLPLDVMARALLRERDHGTSGLVFTAPGVTWRLAAARWLVSVALLTLLSLPGLVRLALTAPEGALAVTAIILSLATWGLAAAAVFRNPRPFELAMVACAYVGVQGAAVFDITLAPLSTAAGHALGLVPAVVLLVALWPRMTGAHGRGGALA